ncbi:ankyrin repeat-containing domain protein [Aspergillus filifer]
MSAVRALLYYGADVRKRDARDLTALHHAVEKGHGHIAQLLLAHGANPWQRGGGKTILELAAMRGDGDLVGLLLDHRQAASVDILDASNTTALTIAAERGNVDVAQAFLLRLAHVAIPGRALQARETTPSSSI